MRSARPLGQGLVSTGTTNLLFFHGTTAISYGTENTQNITHFLDLAP